MYPLLVFTRNSLVVDEPEFEWNEKVIFLSNVICWFGLKSKKATEIFPEFVLTVSFISSSLGLKKRLLCAFIKPFNPKQIRKIIFLMIIFF